MSSWKNRLQGRTSRLLQCNITLIVLLLLLGLSPAAWAGSWSIKYECVTEGNYWQGPWSWPRTPAVPSDFSVVNGMNYSSFLEYPGYVHFRTWDSGGNAYCKVTVTPVLTWSGPEPTPQQVQVLTEVNQAAYTNNGWQLPSPFAIRNSWGDARYNEDDGISNKYLIKKKHVVTVSTSGQTTVRLSSFWMEQSSANDTGDWEAVAECWFKVTVEPLSVYADLGDRFIRLSPDSTESDKVYEGWVQLGYKDDGDPEHAPIPFWSGSAGYSVFTNAFGSGAQYAWTAQGAPLFVYPYPVDKDLIETSTHEKNLTFDFGSPDQGVSLLQLASQFPKETLVTARVTGPNASDPVLAGRVKIRWYPRARLLQMPEGYFGDEPADWFLDNAIEDYLRAQRQFIETGASLTGAGLDLLYVQTAQDLMTGSLLHGVEAMGLLRKALGAINERKYWAKASDTAVKYGNETISILGWRPDRVNVLVIGDAALVARVRHDLTGTNFAVKTLDDLPPVLRSIGVADDVGKATYGAVVRNTDDIAELLGGSGYGSWARHGEVAVANALKQSHPSACGPTSAAMILRDLGYNVSEADVVASLEKNLTTRLDISWALNHFDSSGGWRAMSVRWDDSSFNAALQRPGPWIALMKDSSETIPHWVVVDGLDELGSVVVRDPSTGTQYRMLVEAFEAHFQRTVIAK